MEIEIEQLSDVYAVVGKRIGFDNADILFYENPKLLLSNKEILNIEVEKKRNCLVSLGDRNGKKEKKSI